MSCFGCSQIVLLAHGLRTGTCWLNVAVEAEGSCSLGASEGIAAVWAGTESTKDLPSASVLTGLRRTSLRRDTMWRWEVMAVTD